MARARPKGRSSRGGVGRHVQQYKVNSEPVIKKLAVINYLAVVRKMRATIEHFYPNLAATAYNSKRTTILRWARNRNKLEAAAAAGKGEHKKVRNRGVATILSAENEADSSSTHWAIDEIAADFAAEVDATVRNLGIKRVYNADQTAVFFNMLPRRR
uniref:Uncharacterized protein n=1 Tax=Phytophthora fragariae TaxID=53985 RepID=A0A6A3FRG3_9STRA|nr:hypothetical protein PF009_g3321 [Phytophthora fragariae]